MEIINATFRDIYDVSFGACLKEIGVYVLWSGHAQRRPTYLGEGHVVDRVVTHMRSWDKPFGSSSTLDGCVAIMDEGGDAQRKSDAEIVECTLLHAAEQLDLVPTHNSAPGKRASIHRRGSLHDTIRVNIKGVHPLRNTKLNGTARLTWRWEDGWELVEIPWRRS